MVGGRVFFSPNALGLGPGGHGTPEWGSGKIQGCKDCLGFVNM